MVRQCNFSIQIWWVVLGILFVIYRKSDMKDGIKVESESAKISHSEQVSTVILSKTIYVYSISAIDLNTFIFFCKCSFPIQ